MRVEWTEKAMDRLAAIYVQLKLINQDEVAEVVAEINRKLADNPWDAGESRSTVNQRSWHVYPLTVLFEVLVDDNLVLVQHVAARRNR